MGGLYLVASIAYSITSTSYKLLTVTTVGIYAYYHLQFLLLILLLGYNLNICILYEYTVPTVVIDTKYLVDEMSGIWKSATGFCPFWI